MHILFTHYRLHGGIHPATHKDRTASLPVEDVPVSALVAAPLHVSLHQNIGAPSKTVVAVGSRVLRGQLLAEPGGYVGAAVHAPTSGIVEAIEPHRGSAGGLDHHVRLIADGLDEAAPPMPPLDWRSAPVPAIVERVLHAGIIGMGGAGFPNQVKIVPPPGKVIDTLILNGAECEPWLTCDHRLMVECAAGVWEGALILHRALGGPRVRIAIEANKPDAIEAFARIEPPAGIDAAVLPLKPFYPQGGEKQVIFNVTGREVPAGGLPADAGCVLTNVGTAYAIWDAVVRGNPLISRITTVTGTAVRNPKNLRTRVGMQYRVLFDLCGGLEPDMAKILCGGPMMGFAQGDGNTCIAKATSGILALRAADIASFEGGPCIGCGRCNAVCTLRLLPSEMGLACEADDLDEAKRLGVMNCCECGACAYVCPSRRPLTQHFRRVRGILAARARAAKK